MLKPKSICIINPWTAKKTLDNSYWKGSTIGAFTIWSAFIGFTRFTEIRPAFSYTSILTNSVIYIELYRSCS
jgi:hypothetical protein